MFKYGSLRVVIPVHGNSVKVGYVKDTMALLDKLFPPENDEIEGEDEDDSQ